MPKSQHSKHRSPEPSQNTGQTTKATLRTSPIRHHFATIAHLTPYTNERK